MYLCTCEKLPKFRAIVKLGSNESLNKCLMAGSVFQSGMIVILELNQNF